MCIDRVASRPHKIFDESSSSHPFVPVRKLFIDSENYVIALLQNVDLQTQNRLPPAVLGTCIVPLKVQKPLGQETSVVRTHLGQKYF